MSQSTLSGIARVKKPVVNLSASVRQRLLNLATERKETPFEFEEQRNLFSE